MSGGRALVSGSGTDHIFPYLGGIVQKPLQQGRAVMRPVAVSEAQVHRQRHSKLLRFLQGIGHGPHELRRPGIRTASRLPQSDDQQRCARCRPRVSGIGAASRRNGRHCGSMSGDICAWNQ